MSRGMRLLTMWILTNVDLDEPVPPLLRFDTPNDVQSVA